MNFSDPVRESKDREVLLRVQRMLMEGAPREEVQKIVTDSLLPPMSPSLITMVSVQAGPAPRGSGEYPLSRSTSYEPATPLLPAPITAPITVPTPQRSMTSISTSVTSSVVRPETRREIKAFLDASYSRAPMPRRPVPSHPTPTTSLPSHVHGSRLDPLEAPSESGTEGLPTPMARRETCVPPMLTGPLEDSDPTAGTVWTSAAFASVSAAVTPKARPRPRATPLGGSGSGRGGSVDVGGEFSAGVPRGPPSDVASPTSAIYRRPRRVSVADSFAAAMAESQHSVLGASIDSGLAQVGVGSEYSLLLAPGGSGGGVRRSGTGSGHTLARPPGGGLRRRGSALPVTAYLEALRGAGDSSGDELAVGEEAGRAGGALAGPRFARAERRDTGTFVSLEETRRVLAELGVPYVPDLHVEELEPERRAHMQTGGAAPSVDPVKIADERGLESFVYVAMNIFLRFRFVPRFGFSAQRLLNFFHEAFTFFRPGNPLHNPIHAMDILIAAYQWLSQPSVVAHLSDEEMLAFLFSAAVMRVGHSGIDNRMLTQMRHPYAMMCSYSSPQQGATVALILALLEHPQNRFFPRIFHTNSTEELLSTSSAPGGPREDPLGGSGEAVADATAQTPVVRHAWTQCREYQFFDTVTELVMATDERNHFSLQDGVTRMLEDHFRAHGCLCPVRSNEERYRTLACRRCCCYISDADLPALLKAVLHIMSISYLFRDFDVFITGSLLRTAEMYRQSECQGRLLTTTERLQRFAAQAQQRRAAAAAATSAMSSAESSTTNGTAAKAIATAMMPAAAGEGEGEGHDDGAPTTTSQARVGAAIMSEQPMWRADALHSSTLSILRTIQSMPAGEQARMLLPDGGAAARPPRPRPEESDPSPRRGVPVGVDGEPELPSLSLPSTPSPVQPLGALQGYGRDIFLVSVEDVYFPFLDTLAPYLPHVWARNGRRNHEHLLAAVPTPEEYDTVVEKILFLTSPEPAEGARVVRPAGSGAAAALSQYQYIPGYGRAPVQPTLAELRAAVPLANRVPFELMRRLVPAQPRWHFDRDGIESRVLAEIAQAGAVWTSFSALYEGILRGQATGAAPPTAVAREGKGLSGAAARQIAAPLGGS